VAMMSRTLAFALASVLLPISTDPASALDGRLEVVGGEFRLQLDDGRVLEREALVGARLSVRNGTRDVPLVIDGVERIRHASGGTALAYRLLVEDPAQGARRNLCQPDAYGRQLGFPIPKQNGFDLTCTSGAEGKCILMGYRPWDERADAPMRDLHAACIHMVRADYGGDNHPTTRDGTTIDVYDRFGVQKPETRDPMPFEAAWGPHGALCVAHPRIAQNITLETLEKRYPHLKGRLGVQACTEENLGSHPDAILFNRSALTAP
jgi:hypothetical protein